MNLINIKTLQNIPNTGIGKALNAARWFGGRAVTQPFYVEVGLTYRCNLSCAYCYQAPEKRTAFPDMSFEDVKALEENMRSSFFMRPRIYLFGGEPAIHPDFMGVLGYFSRKGYRVSFATNGLALEGRMREVISERGVENVIISLNPFNMDVAGRLLDEARSVPARRNRKVSLNCPVDAVLETGETLAEIAERFQGSGAAFLSFQHSQSVFLRGRAIDAGRILGQIRELGRKKYRIPVFFFPGIKGKDLKAYYTDPAYPCGRKRCVLPWFDLFVRPDGDVVPCDEVDLVMGNVKREKLKDIWNNKAYRAFRAAIQREGVSQPICARCCHRQYY